jgi:antitoxin ParD1/3/4
MATMNISLPDEMKEWVESQVASGRYGNSSDVMRDLVRREQERQDYIAYIQKAVDDGIASGFSEVNLDTLVEDVIQSVRNKKNANSAA